MKRFSPRRVIEISGPCRPQRPPSQQSSKRRSKENFVKSEKLSLIQKKLLWAIKAEDVQKVVKKPYGNDNLFRRNRTVYSTRKPKQSIGSRLPSSYQANWESSKINPAVKINSQGINNSLRSQNKPIADVSYVSRFTKREISGLQRKGSAETIMMQKSTTASPTRQLSIASLAECSERLEDTVQDAARKYRVDKKRLRQAKSSTLLKATADDRQLRILKSCRSEMAEKFPHLEIDAKDPEKVENHEIVYRRKAATYKPNLKRVRSAEFMRPQSDIRSEENRSEMNSLFASRPSTRESDIQLRWKSRGLKKDVPTLRGGKVRKAQSGRRFTPVNSGSLTPNHFSIKKNCN